MLVTIFTVNIDIMISRLIEPTIVDYLNNKNKLIIIYGPRQAGKTTLVKKIQESQTSSIRTKYLNCDNDEDLVQINTTSLTTLKRNTEQIDLLIIDEAQRLKDPGLTLKIIYDNLQPLKVVVTGSSSFDLHNRLTDALTGRYYSFYLYPLSWVEVVDHYVEDEHIPLKKAKADTLLESFLLYGFYPNVVLEPSHIHKQVLLQDILESSLFKDILAFDRVKNSTMILNLCKALAYQIGSEVSEHELSKRLEINRKTVQYYLNLLEQTFVIFRVYPYSKNQRREIGKKYKIFFADLGIRNALIGDFNTPQIRTDVGGLWENFLISERIKTLKNGVGLPTYHFWKNYKGEEIDWLEKPLNHDFEAYEFKFTRNKLSKGALNFAKEYQFPLTLINRDNYHDFLSHP